MNKDFPSKLYYSISEVAGITGIKAHVLRYWETEFSTLRPKKGSSGSRRYRKQDIEEVLAIKNLLYDEGYKIAGARKMRLEARRNKPAKDTPAPQMALPLDRMDHGQKLDFVKAELAGILELVRELPGAEGSTKKPVKSKAARG